MKTIIAGSRTITDYDELLFAVEKFNLMKWGVITEIVSGTARGADKLGERYAKENDIPLKKFPADWDTYGRRAGYLRNEEMGEYADAAIILWNGLSKGAMHMYNIAHKLGLKVVLLDCSKCRG